MNFPTNFRKEGAFAWYGPDPMISCMNRQKITYFNLFIQKVSILLKENLRRTTSGTYLVIPSSDLSEITLQNFTFYTLRKTEDLTGLPYATRRFGANVPLTWLPYYRSRSIFVNKRRAQLQQASCVC